MFVKYNRIFILNVMKIVTRFAPSPTGMLHIGSARTALFSYLFAKKHNGDFLLRIEDTDKQRNSQEAVDAIVNGLEVLNITHNGDIVFQSSRIERHVEIANKMLQNGTAYYAYDTQEELEKMREEAQKNKTNFLYDGSKWKNKTTKIPDDIKPVVRLNVPEGKTSFNDGVRGFLEFDNKTLDDLVLLRSDGTPTYMLSVVVDDIDMGITHVIRGEDHISNTPKQILIYQALRAKVPEFSHIPMIHDIEGKKLSKRKNAVAVDDYIQKGYLPEAIFNHLLHLGWNDGTEKEIYTQKEAIEAFSIERIGKSPSRFDFDKLKNINLHYTKQMSDEIFVDYLVGFYQKTQNTTLNNNEILKAEKIADELKKVSTFLDITESFNPMLDSFEHGFKEEDLFKIKNKTAVFNIVVDMLLNLTPETNIKEVIDVLIIEKGLKMSDVASAIRFVVLGRWHSFAISKIFETLSNEEIKSRVIDFQKKFNYA
jgi:glutamyl-tRNA synthetase